MSPLQFYCLLSCGVLSAATLFRRLPVVPVEGQEVPLRQVTAVSNVQCSAACMRAGLVCLAFRYAAPTCRLIAAPSLKHAGTFGRVPKLAPGGYHTCYITSYRVYPPMTRGAAVETCTDDGGRLAVPIAPAERDCVRQVVAAAGTDPTISPSNILRDTAYVGMMVHGPSSMGHFNVTDLKGRPLTVPTEAWAAGEPDRELAEGQSAPLVISDGSLRDWETSIDLLMNVCEVLLME